MGRAERDVTQTWWASTQDPPVWTRTTPDYREAEGGHWPLTRLSGGKSMPNNFQNLRAPGVGVKMFKFKQSKTIPFLNPRREVNQQVINTLTLTDQEFDGVKGGVCAALACAWLAEKLSSNGDDFEGNSAGPDIHSGSNLNVVEAAVPKYLNYRKNSDVHELLEDYGVKISYGMHPEIKRKREETTRDKRGMMQFATTLRVLETLVATTAVAVLPQGKGAYVAIRCESTVPDRVSGGHAVAVYRSRGNTLYFFDPNCGVYKVLDATRFFGAWIAGYTALGFDVTMSDNHAPFIFVKR
jgi:hypothetical protein